MDDILSAVENEAAALSDADIQAQLEGLMKQKKAQAERQKEYNSSPEAKAKRAEYNKLRAQDPDVIEKRKEYQQRPETKERNKVYRQKRAAEQKAILAEAAKRGITLESLSGQ